MIQRAEAEQRLSNRLCILLKWIRIRLESFSWCSAQRFATPTSTEWIFRFFHIITVHQLPFLRAEADVRGLRGCVQMSRIEVMCVRWIRVFERKPFFRHWMVRAHKGSRQVVWTRTNWWVRNHHRRYVGRCMEALAQVVMGMVFSGRMMNMLRAVDGMRVDRHRVNLLFHDVWDLEEKIRKRIFVQWTLKLRIDKTQRCLTLILIGTL